MNQTIWAIPDIHGRSDLLKRLWVRLTEDHGLDLARDRVIFLGDMIDRGPDSKGVIDFIRDLQTRHPDAVEVLAGNHEWLAINAYARGRMEDMTLWMYNGGCPTSDSYGGIVPDEVIKWMAGLPVSYEQDGFFFSHAPVPKEEFRRATNRGQPYTLNELTWTYFGENAEEAAVGHPTMVGVCGHIHRLQQGIMEPRFYAHYIFADAGAGCSSRAPLVAINVKTREVVYARPSEITSPIEAQP